MAKPTGLRHPAAITGIVLAAVLVLCCGLGTVLSATGVINTTDTAASARPSATRHSPTLEAAATVSPAAAPSAKPATAKGTGKNASSALALLAKLPVRSWASMAGYSRAQFGPAWADVDHNGCDTRDDILRRDLTGITTRTDGCTVLTGTLHDPYTGRTIDFHRGVGTSTAVQIDHVVALADAWRTGAQKLSASRREQLANDPLELLAVDGPTNESKGDQDAASWLPPNTSFDCSYVADQIAVKHAYGLWVTQAEHDAMARVLQDCGGTVPAPTRTTAPAPARTTAAPPAPKPSPTHTTSGGGSNYPTVHPGAYCSPEGAYGVTSKGTLMQCRSVDGDQPRWRSAG